MCTGPQTQTIFDPSGTVEYTLVKPFGNCDDDSPCFEEEKVKFVEAIDALSAAGGGDTPESQTVALFNAATEWVWRQGVLKVRDLGLLLFELLR